MFLEASVQAVVPIVREFHANGRRPNLIKYSDSWVRGKTVEYGSGAINKVLGLPDLASCDYKANIFLHANEIEPEVTRVIAIHGSGWLRSKGAPGKRLHLKEGRFHEIAWGVYKFVCSRLMPTGHQPDMTWPRVVVVYTILIGGLVDIGDLIL